MAVWFGPSNFATFVSKRTHVYSLQKSCSGQAISRCIEQYNGIVQKRHVMRKSIENESVFSRKSTNQIHLIYTIVNLMITYCNESNQIKSYNTICNGNVWCSAYVTSDHTTINAFQCMNVDLM